MKLNLHEVLVPNFIKNTVKNCYQDRKISKSIIFDFSLPASKSSIHKEKHNYQLPYGYVVQRTEHFEYKLCDTSEVKLFIVMENGCIVDMFFKTNQDHTHPEVENTITTFLSLLNFY